MYNMVKGMCKVNCRSKVDLFMLGCFLMSMRELGIIFLLSIWLSLVFGVVSWVVFFVFIFGSGIGLFLDVFF